MNGTPRYASRDQNSAMPASRVEYSTANAAIHTATTSVIPKNAALTAVTRRISTRVPKARISTAVNATGTAYAENAYAPGGSTAIQPFLSYRERDRGYCRR